MDSRPRAGSPRPPDRRLLRGRSMGPLAAVSTVSGMISRTMASWQIPVAYVLYRFSARRRPGWAKLARPCEGSASHGGGHPPRQAHQAPRDLRAVPGGRGRARRHAGDGRAAMSVSDETIGAKASSAYARYLALRDRLDDPGGIDAPMVGAMIEELALTLTDLEASTTELEGQYEALRRSELQLARERERY